MELMNRELMDKSGVRTVNEVVVQGAAMAAWKSRNRVRCPLQHNTTEGLGRYPTRALTAGLIQPAAVATVADNNLAKIWNASADRLAKRREQRRRSRLSTGSRRWPEAVGSGREIFLLQFCPNCTYYFCSSEGTLTV